MSAFHLNEKQMLFLLKKLRTNHDRQDFLSSMSNLSFREQIDYLKRNNLWNKDGEKQYKQRAIICC